MNSCEALPATGSNIGAFVVIATAAVVSGLVLWRLGRHRHATAAVVAVLVAIGAVAAAGSTTAGAAADCPPEPPSGVSPTIETAPPTTVTPPTTAPPATTTPVTTGVPSTTTTTTTSTLPQRAPEAIPSNWDVGASPFSISVLDNDYMGDPTATVSSWSIPDPLCSAVISFDPATGTVSGVMPATVPVCFVLYELSNSAGTSQTEEGFSATTTTTTTSTTSTTLAPRAPTATGTLHTVSPGVYFEIAAFADDDLGEPAATATLDAIIGPLCSGNVDFDPATGIISGTLPFPTTCIVTYTLTNSSGSSTASEDVLPLL